MASSSASRRLPPEAAIAAFAIRAGRHAYELLKATGEVALIRKAVVERDFGQGQVRRCQQFARLGHPALNDVAMRRQPDRSIERPREMGGGHANERCELVDIQRGIE